MQTTSSYPAPASTAAAAPTFSLRDDPRSLVEALDERIASCAQKGDTAAHFTRRLFERFPSSFSSSSSVFSGAFSSTTRRLQGSSQELPEERGLAPGGNNSRNNLETKNPCSKDISSKSLWSKNLAKCPLGSSMLLSFPCKHGVVALYKEAGAIAGSGERVEELIDEIEATESLAQLWFAMQRRDTRSKAGEEIEGIALVQALGFESLQSCFTLRLHHAALSPVGAFEGLVKPQLASPLSSPYLADPSQSDPLVNGDTLIGRKQSEGVFIQALRAYMNHLEERERSIKSRGQHSVLSVEELQAMRSSVCEIIYSFLERRHLKDFSSNLQQRRCQYAGLAVLFFQIIQDHPYEELDALFSKGEGSLSNLPGLCYSAWHGGLEQLAPGHRHESSLYQMAKEYKRVVFRSHVTPLGMELASIDSSDRDNVHYLNAFESYFQESAGLEYRPNTHENEEIIRQIFAYYVTDDFVGEAMRLMQEHYRIDELIEQIQERFKNLASHQKEALLQPLITAYRIALRNQKAPLIDPCYHVEALDRHLRALVHSERVRREGVVVSQGSFKKEQENFREKSTEDFEEDFMGDLTEELSLLESLYDQLETPFPLLFLEKRLAKIEQERGVAKEKLFKKLLEELEAAIPTPSGRKNWIIERNISLLEQLCLEQRGQSRASALQLTELGASLLGLSEQLLVPHNTSLLPSPLSAQEKVKEKASTTGLEIRGVDQELLQGIFQGIYQQSKWDKLEHAEKIDDPTTLIRLLQEYQDFDLMLRGSYEVFTDTVVMDQIFRNYEEPLARSLAHLPPSSPLLVDLLMATTLCFANPSYHSRLWALLPKRSQSDPHLLCYVLETAPMCDFLALIASLPPTLDPTREVAEALFRSSGAQATNEEASSCFERLKALPLALQKKRAVLIALLNQCVLEELPFLMRYLHEELEIEDLSTLETLETLETFSANDARSFTSAWINNVPEEEQRLDLESLLPMLEAKWITKRLVVQAARHWSKEHLDALVDLLPSEEYFTPQLLEILFQRANPREFLTLMGEIPAEKRGGKVAEQIASIVLTRCSSFQIRPLFFELLSWGDLHERSAVLALKRAEPQEQQIIVKALSPRVMGSLSFLEQSARYLHSSALLQCLRVLCPCALLTSFTSSKDPREHVVFQILNRLSEGGKVEWIELLASQSASALLPQLLPQVAPHLLSASLVAKILLKSDLAITPQLLHYFSTEQRSKHLLETPLDKLLFARCLDRTLRFKLVCSLPAGAITPKLEQRLLAHCLKEELPLYLELFSQKNLCSLSVACFAIERAQEEDREALLKMTVEHLSSSSLHAFASFLQSKGFCLAEPLILKCIERCPSALMFRLLEKLPQKKLSEAIALAVLSRVERAKVQRLIVLLPQKVITTSVIEEAVKRSNRFALVGLLRACNREQISARAWQSAFARCHKSEQKRLEGFYRETSRKTSGTPSLGSH